MQRLLLAIFAGCALAGCSMELPGFLGRTGDASSTFQLGGPDPLPDPVPITITAARLEPALRGIIVRAEGVAPTQGYYAAEFLAIGAGEPDTAGIINFALTAVPPPEPEPVGPPNTRELSAAFFIPTAEIKGIAGFRIAGAGGQLLTLRMPQGGR